MRNPATYLKRSELATPKGIDHDYNFISGIERKLDSADRDAAFRGVVLHEYDGAASRRGHAKGVEQLRKEIVDLGVVIRQAPKGMSRSKQNTTKWNNQYGSHMLDQLTGSLLTLMKRQMHIMDSRVGPPRRAERGRKMLWKRGGI